MTIFGIDLSGPRNYPDTAAACFVERDNALEHVETALGLDDLALLEFVQRHAADGPLVIALDAPLSYQPGGGQRSADAELRRLLVQRGLHPGSVMAPTMMRMVYLTLRGLGVARLFQLEYPEARIVEVHPTGAMALRGADPKLLSAFKKDETARDALVSWLKTQGLTSLPAVRTDHELAALAAALAAWQWLGGRPAWLHVEDPPIHPFPFAC